MTVTDPPAGRLLLAFRPDQTLDWTPTWTRIDSYPSLVTRYTIDRGRMLELDRTDTGRATVEIADTQGILDPTNVDGPYYGKIEPLLQAMIGRYNPISETWHTRFRGWVEELDYSFDPSQQVNRLTISLVDIFAMVAAAAEMQPGGIGDPPPADQEAAGMVWLDSEPVDSRISRLLAGVGIPDDYSVVFSGNVLLYGTAYSPGESVVTAIQEAAEAEFPGSPSNVYGDRHGRLVFHGRRAKFDPEGTEASATPGAWDFIRWKAGDSTAVAGDPVGTAHLREFAFNRGVGHVINSATATPNRETLTATQIAAQLVEDTTSIALRGVRSWEAQNLLTKAGLLDDSDDLAETRHFAEYYVANYAVPHNRATDCGFRSMHPDWQGATKTWELLSKIDISDHLEVTVGSPGGGGFTGEGFFVEGIHETVEPLNPDYDDVTLTLDLSPDTVYASDPFIGAAPDDPADPDGDTGTGTPPAPGPGPGDPGDDWIEDQPFAWNGPEFTVPRHTWVTIPFTAPVMSRNSNVTGYGTQWTNIDWDDPASARWIDPDTPRVLTVPHDMRAHANLNWLQIYLRLEHPAVEAGTSYRALRVFETTNQQPIIQAFVLRADAGGGIGAINVYIGDGHTSTMLASGDTGGLEAGLHDGMMVMPDATVGWLWCGDWLPTNADGDKILTKGMRLVPQVWHDATVPLVFDCAGVAPYRPHFVFDTVAERNWGSPWNAWPVY